MNTLKVEFDNETPDGTIRGLKISNADGTRAHYSKTWADTACHFALALGELADLRRQLAQAQEKIKSIENLCVCGFCNFIVDRSEEGWKDRLADHILKCEKHPLAYAMGEAERWELLCRAANEKLAELTADAEGMVGSSREVRAEAEKMRAKLAAQQAIIDRLDVVRGWAQSVLTALNIGDVKSESLLHKKLREVMIAYRAASESARKEQGNE